MTNQLNNVFRYSGYSYTIAINLYTLNANPNDNLRVSFDAADVEQVVYESKLNDLLIKGHIIYTDKYAMVDKLMTAHYCYCDIMFAQNSNKSDHDTGMSQFDKEKRFMHTFIVSNIKIIARLTSIIKYEIDFISYNWLNCSANIAYSNYGMAAQPIFDIVKTCLINNGLAIHKDSFDRVKTTVTERYISHRNDNMFTVLKYLMHKLYYWSELRDDSLKFIVYDQFENKYRLIDIKDSFTYVGSYSTMLSFFKTNNETMIQQEPTNIGSFEQPITKQQVYSNLFDKHMFGYDYRYNMFIDTFMQSNEIATYMNNRLDNAYYKPKYQTMIQLPDMTYEQVGSYWNNKFDVYNKAITILEENNSFILNVTGDIRRQPGSLNNIILDRSIANATSDDKKELEEMKKKYKAYEGMWLASKVRTIIRPNIPSFRQQVVLFRNFIPKLNVV